MVIFEVTTCAVPFRAASGATPPAFAISALVEHGVRPAVPATFVYDDTRRELLALHRKCTQTQPTRRPNAAQLVKKMDKLLQATANEVLEKKIEN